MKHDREFLSIDRARSSSPFERSWSPLDQGSKIDARVSPQLEAGVRFANA